jgi:hypothetical protein
MQIFVEIPAGRTCFQVRPDESVGAVKRRALSCWRVADHLHKDVRLVLGGHMLQDHETLDEHVRDCDTLQLHKPLLGGMPKKGTKKKKEKAEGGSSTANADGAQEEEEEDWHVVIPKVALEPVPAGQFLTRAGCSCVCGRIWMSQRRDGSSFRYSDLGDVLCLNPFAKKQLPAGQAHHVGSPRLLTPPANQHPIVNHR